MDSGPSRALRQRLSISLADLTVHGVTRPTTWKVTARTDGTDIVGLATTAFTFKDFALGSAERSRRAQRNDTIKLEYDFRFTPAANRRHVVYHEAYGARFL